MVAELICDIWGGEDEEEVEDEEVEEEPEPEERRSRPALVRTGFQVGVEEGESKATACTVLTASRSL
jgi:hypothetical protein